MTPDEWLKDFESKVSGMQREAASFRRNLESAGETVTSADGKLTVSVAPNGALLDLTIDDAAVSGKGAELAAKILALVRTAREGAATHVVDSFRPLVGGAADELDTDVSVPDSAADGGRESGFEDEDEDGFGERAIFESDGPTVR